MKKAHRMAEELENVGLLGPKEWLTIIAIAIAVYLYRAFHHILPSSAGSAANTSAAAQANLDEETRRRAIQEARSRLLRDSERVIEENREKLKVSLQGGNFFCPCKALLLSMLLSQASGSRLQPEVQRTFTF